VTWKPIAIGLLYVGCAAQLGGGSKQDDNGDPPGTNPDGGNGSNGGNGDASVQPPGMDAANAACPNGRKIYLAFDSVTLTKATTSNAATNEASWLTAATSNVPAWHSNSATRANDIASVVSGVKSRLGTAPIEVVTTKPTTGPFVMIVFGGQSTGNGGTVATIYRAGTNYHDCGDIVKSDVGWVADGFNLTYTADLAVGAVGFGLGLDGTTDPNDCMCGWGSNCNSATGACTLSANIPSQISYNTETACPNQNPQNEVAAFTTKFCQ